MARYITFRRWPFWRFGWSAIWKGVIPETFWNPQSHRLTLNSTMKRQVQPRRPTERISEEAKAIAWVDKEP
jgi:hypothetical protein